jgi:hypothetical protein
MSNSDIFGAVEGLDPDLDISKVLDSVAKILETVSIDEMLALKEKDFKKYQDEMEEKYPEFSKRYYAIFMKVIKHEDITPLMVMLSIMSRIKSGEITYKEGEIEMGKVLGKMFIRKNDK